jgi:hypothetical protein
MTKLRHIITGKIYDWDGKSTLYYDPPNLSSKELRDIKEEFLTIPHIQKVAVRTNAEVYPEEFYDFSHSELDGQTQYYVEERLDDFEIIEDKQ